MFCSKCGKQLPDNAKFCPGCGSPIEPIPVPVAEEPTPVPVTEEPIPTPAEESVSVPPVVEETTPEGSQGEEPPEGGKKKLSPLMIVIPIVAVVAIIVGFFAFRAVSANMAYEKNMTAGDAAMEALDYAEALRCYQLALEGKPNSEETKAALDRAVTQALGQVENDLREGQYDQAAALLETLMLSEDNAGYDRYIALLEAAKLNPHLTAVNTASHPVVVVTLTCGADVVADEVRVSEGGVDRHITDLACQNGVLTLSYETDEAGYASEHRELTVTVTKAGIDFTCAGSYDTPRFEPASVRLVSTDVSAFPLVRAYFRVERVSDGGTVADLGKEAFVIRERLQGGEFLAREVRAVSPLESQGLNIDLVADKSSSISYSDMGKIKQVMSQFVRSLRYDVGDKAEVLAFDDIVQQMCYYTNDVALLINGINNMSTDGTTAFYDAVHDGIRNASLQGGARCVIAFTDGMDNRSHYTASEVINYANTNQVPVYIIGVGYGVEERTLRGIATSTGGRYWYIDDLYDLQQIFTEIYAEQKELYMVEYVSDGAQYDPRDIAVRVTGGGYKGEVQSSFQPVYSVQGLKHNSRYELIKEAVTWEEANRRCQEMGGHLATITSQSEQDQIIALAEANDVKYVWLGGYTSYDNYGNVFGHWVTGEDFSFQSWSATQPSRVDLDGTPEWYIMLWNVRASDGWCWNDQRNDPASAVKSMASRMAFVCEYES